MSSSSPVKGDTELNSPGGFSQILAAGDVTIDQLLQTSSLASNLFNTSVGGDAAVEVISDYDFGYNDDEVSQIQRLQTELKEMRQCLGESKTLHEREIAQLQHTNQLLQNELTTVHQTATLAAGDGEGDNEYSSGSFKTLNKSLQEELNRLLQENIVSNTNCHTV